VAAAGLLLATGELAGWSIDLRSVAPEGRAVTRDRVATTVLLAVGAAVVAAGVLAASDLPAPGGVLPELVGLGALLAVISFAALRKW
jgi:hypothetical protein